LLEDISIRGARGILINISSSPDFSMDELREICTIIQDEAHENALIKWGLVYDESLAEEIRVTVIATGIGKKAEVDRDVPLWQPATPETPEMEDLEIPTILRKGEFPRTAESQTEKRPPSLGVVSGRKYVVHPDLQYEESELDTPPFLRKAD
jgi:cell division protein FtsZ